MYIGDNWSKLVTYHVKMHGNLRFRTGFVAESTVFNNRVTDHLKLFSLFMMTLIKLSQNICHRPKRNCCSRTGYDENVRLSLALFH